MTLPAKRTEAQGAVPTGSCCCEVNDTEPCTCPKVPLRRRLADGIRYAFGPLLRDIGPYLLAGITIAGIITGLIPDGFIEQHLGSGITSMLIMLAAGIPIYVCASASTPIVAALALKGLSPGAALVFLLVGPATNAAVITVVAGMLGKQVAVIYVSVIAVCALVLGMAVNALYGWLEIDISSWATGAQHSEGGLFSTLAAIALLGLIARKLQWDRPNMALSCDAVSVTLNTVQCEGLPRRVHMGTMHIKDGQVDRQKMHPCTLSLFPCAQM